MTNDTTHFKDHFSGHAGLYAKARPHYPDVLFAWIAQTAPARGLCWDAGCGNGQASVALARHFERVVATDPSGQQLGNAEARPNVEYRCERAENATLADHSADVVTVAQALHWFDLPAFVTEVRRVAKPDALFAAWCYAGFRVTPAVDAVVGYLYDDILGNYWTPERRLVDEGYASLALPFVAIGAPAFEMRCDWNLAHWLAYLRSWSAAQRYLKLTGCDAVTAITDELIAAWGDPEESRAVRWTLAIRAGRLA
ncbi:MAG: class I SAM-dependent methyltransferase [Rhodanobacteraceae bacterium]